MKCYWADDCEAVGQKYRAPKDGPVVADEVLCFDHRQLEEKFLVDLRASWGANALCFVAVVDGVLPIQKSKLYDQSVGRFWVRTGAISVINAPSFKSPISICSWFLGKSFEEARKIAEDVQVELGMAESVGKVKEEDQKCPT